MQLFEGYTGMYYFEVLPAFVQYILKHRLNDYVTETIRLSRKMQLPMLTYLSNWPEAELFEYSKKSSAEFLTYLAQNKAKEEIQNAVLLWQQDQLSVVGKYDIIAEDLTLIVYIRSKALKTFIPDYTADVRQVIKLVEELDTFNLGEITTATSTYINILKDRINQEVYFNNKLANTTPGMIYVYDLAEHKTIYANKKANDLFGFSQQPDPDITTGLTSLIHPEDLPEWYEHFKALESLQDEETGSFEHRIKTVEGNYYWVRNYETVFKRNADGKPAQIIVAAYDITGEKRDSHYLQHSKTQLLEAQSIAQLGSFEWNLVTEETNNTDQFYSIFEIPKGTKFNRFLLGVHPDDKAKLLAAFDAAMQTGKYECEYRYIANGREKYIWSKGIVTFQNNRPYKMSGTIQDITERRKIEEILLQKTMELEKTNASLLEFTYVASHDLKEPLRKIATYTDIILTRQQHLDEAMQGYFAKIVDSSRRMQKMIDDILALSSLPNNTVKEKANLQTILNDVLLLLEHIIQRKKAVVTSDDLPDAYVIPSLFRQLFLNLISNALKFSRKDVPPQITITHSYLDAKKIVTSNKEAACYIAIKVADNGIGFSNEFSQKIFTLFQRLHNDKEYEGTGLGLAICKRIVEEHHGMIYANGKPGEGAVFTIIVPLQTG